MPIFVGTNDDDFITGGSEDDVIQGLAGDDRLNGEQGENVIEGGDGDDFITSMNGIDIIDGGAGIDHLSFSRQSSSVGLHIDLTSPSPVATGDGGSVVGIESMAASGGSGDDVFVGGAMNDNLSGRGGADHLDGGAGNDVIHDDERFIGAFDDTIIGGAGDDMITSTEGSDAIDGGAGFDFAFLYRDRLSVALHVDLSTLGESPVDIGDGTTLSGIERIGILAGSGDDVFIGGAFADSFNGGNGDDDLAGGAGDDSLLGESGDDTVRGGGGDDTLQGRVVHGDDGDDDIAGGSDLAATDMLFGDAGNDSIQGGGGANVMHGGAGDDSIGGAFTSANEILGEDGNDVLNGGDGDDVIDGGAGNDAITSGDGVDELNGGDGIDLISLFLPFPSQDPITFDISDADQGTITLASGTTITDFERVNIQALAGDDDIAGGAFDDIVTAGQGDDLVHGGGGADIIRGDGGSDFLDGGAGDDQIEDFDDLDNPGVDSISGGDGNDFVFTMGNPGDILDGGAGVDTLRLSFSGLDQALTLTLGDAMVAGVALASFEIAFFSGTEFNDVLTGGGLNDELWGATGDDRLFGLAGDDRLLGFGGSDVLIGGAGNDILEADVSSFPVTSLTDQLFGGAGDDILRGGPGADLLEGGDGNDTLSDRDGGGTLRGGAGDDVIIAAPGAGWILDGGAGFDTMEIETSLNLTEVTFTGVERLFGAEFGAFILYTPGQLDGLSEILVWGIRFVPNGSGVTNFSAVNMPAQVPGAFTSLPASFYFDGTPGVDTLIMPASGLAAVTASGFEGNDALVGGGGGDTLIGGLGNDTLSGGGGDDSFVLDLISGVDQIFGGVAGADSGFDTIDLSNAAAAVIVQLSGYAVTAAGGTLLATFSGLEGAVGSNFDDALIGTASANRLVGGGGSDWLVGAGGDDVFALSVDGGGVDRVFGGDANADSGFDMLDFSFQPRGVVVDLSSGNATTKAGVLLAFFTGIEGVVGSFENDTLIGTAGDNRFAGAGGIDWIVGAAGDDWFVHDGDFVVVHNGDSVIARPDNLFGDAGVDTLDHSSSFEGVIIDMSGHTSNRAGILLANLFDIENAIGSRFDDTLIGAAGANSLSGGDGDDRFVQGAATAVDVLNGGAGVDTLDYGAAGSGIVVQLAGWSTLNGGALLATLTGIENAIGSSFNDALIGNASNNRITGGAGSDWLVGQGGDDTFVQAIETGATDRLFGDAGVDTLDYSSANAAVTVQLSGYATSGGATLATFTGIENATSAAFNDVLVGNASNNVLAGGAGGDWLVGGDGNDTFVQTIDTTSVDRIFGGTPGADSGVDTIDYSGAGAGVVVQLSGYASTNGGGAVTLATFAGIENAVGTAFNDALVGNASDNRLTGGTGGDWLVGGLGADAFVYQSIADGAGDSIRDFSQVQLDRIDLSAIDANPGAIGDQAFAFALTRTPGVVGQAVATPFNGSTLISLYVDGDNVADMTIQVVHQPGLVMVQGDFIL